MEFSTEQAKHTEFIGVVIIKMQISPQTTQVLIGLPQSLSDLAQREHN